MSGSLVLLDEQVVSSAVASVTLGDTNWDSSYDVYLVEVIGAEIDSATQQSLQIRVTVSGSADSTANYDSAMVNMNTFTSFYNESGANGTAYAFSNQISTATQSQTNANIYLFNFNNSSAYSYATVEGVDRRYGGNLYGRQGGFCHTVAQACDGVNITAVSGANIDSGIFRLYALNK